MTLQGKFAIVTGASRGIGRAIAERLASDGAGIVVNYYPPEKPDADEVVKTIDHSGGAAVAAPADVRNADELRHLFDVAQDSFGGVDIFVSNAANVRQGTIVDTTDEEFDATFATNARAGFVALRESALRLRDGGRFVAISAGLTVMVRPGTGVYAASKAAVDHLVRVLAREIGHRGITVNSVLPGATLTSALTDFAASPAGRAFIEREVAATPLGRVGEPNDIADVVAFLASDQARWITGQTIGVGGGLF